jgi:uncharacterized protein
VTSQRRGRGAFAHRAALFVAIVSSGWLAAAPSGASAPEVPHLEGRVNDNAGMLTADAARALDAKLAAFEQQTGHQFALLSVPTLNGEDIEGYSIHVAEQWKLGDKRRDDGLILVVALNDHKMRIEVGYGLEGDIPDAISSRVIREVLQPAFRNQDYAGGLNAAFDVLMRAAGGDASALPQQPDPRRVQQPRHARGEFPIGLVGIVVIFIIFSFFSGGSGGSRRRGFWGLGGFGGGGFGGGGGGFGGGGFGGGGGGGGFSGGGGGFGGGGASGGW